MKLITALLAVILLLMANSAQAQPATNDITIGHKDVHYSKTLKEKREVWIHVPGNLAKGKTENRYPVVYVLDGEQHFLSVTGLVQQMSEANGNTAAPQMIVVSILSPDRARDFTPTHQVGGPLNDPEFAKTSGGAEAFTTYLHKELMPHIDSLYPTAPYRTLVGHSLGGLMVVNTLMHHTTLFNAYVALEPSLWWDYNLLLKQADTALRQEHFAGKSFYMAIANTIGAGIDTAMMHKDTTEASIQFRSQTALISILQQKAASAGLRWGYSYYKGEDHSSVPLVGTYDAFRNIFDYYKLPPFNQFWEPDFNADSAIRAHFQTISSKLGYKVHPPRDLMDGLGHAFLQYGMPDKAAGLFTINLENYPAWAGSHTAMGDYYAAQKETTKAINCYQKSLAIASNKEVMDKLKALQAKD